MKKFVCLVLAGVMLLSLVACSGGVSQEEYDAVIAERDRLQTELSDVEAEIGDLTKKNEELEATLSEYQKEDFSVIHELFPGYKDAQFFNFEGANQTVLNIVMPISIFDGDASLAEDMGKELGNAVPELVKMGYDYVQLSVITEYGPLSTNLVDCKEFEIKGINWLAEDSDVSGESGITGLNPSQTDSESKPDAVLVEKDGVKITYTGVNNDESYYGVKVLIENNSEQTVCIQVRDESINGYMVSGVFSCSVMPGKKANDTIRFLESELKSNGIAEVDSVELYFHVFNDDTWATIFDSEIVTIKP